MYIVQEEVNTGRALEVSTILQKKGTKYQLIEKSNKHMNEESTGIL